MPFRKNMSMMDRAIRMVLGFILIVLAGSGVIGLWGLVGLVLIASSYAAHCPTYDAIRMTSLGEPDYSEMRNLKGR